MKVLVTGSQGFIGAYICSELLKSGYDVIGIDNYSKYGVVEREHDKHPKFKLYEMDVRRVHDEFYSSERIDSFSQDIRDADFIIAGAAMIGGISYFHAKAFDLLAVNEEILAATFRLAIDLNKKHNLKRIVVLSSSMVFEQTSKYPTPESEILTCPPPLSTYGFQKLASEYFCKGAWEQYKLPYTILRPFNCVGIGEYKALDAEEVSTAKMKLLLSHCLPDLINKSLQLGQNDKLPILGDGNQVRHYTNGKDIAIGVRMAMESAAATNNDFNISHSRAMTVLELAGAVWKKIHGTELIVENLPPFEYDVQVRSPDVSKAKEVFGFEAKIDIDQSIDEVVEWMRGNL